MKKLAINGGNKEVIGTIEEKWKDIREKDIEKVGEYLKNQPISVIDGGILKEFEDEFAKFVNVKYAVAYCNGTAALHAASYACGASKNTNFILSEYSYHGTVNSLLENSSNAYLCDFDDETMCIDMDNAEKLIDSTTKGMIITHCWGNPVDMDKVRKIREKYNLRIISDASHAHGAMWNGKNIGGLDCEDIACFSLGKNKLISAGELGVAVTNSKEIYDELLFMGHPNRIPTALLTDKYTSYTNGIGNKYRPHPLSMVLAVEQIKRFDEKKENNIRTNEYLNEQICKVPGFKPIKVYDKSDRVYWKLLVRMDKEYWNGIKLEKVAKALMEEGIVLEQFHNYKIREHEYIWKHPRYDGQVFNKSIKDTPDDMLILPGYVKLDRKDMNSIINCFEKVSKNKEELK